MLAVKKIKDFLKNHRNEIFLGMGTVVVSIVLDINTGMMYERAYKKGADHGFELGRLYEGYEQWLKENP